MDPTLFLEIYAIVGALNAAFFYWSIGAQDRMMGQDSYRRTEWVVEAFVLWPAFLPLNLLLWAIVLVKSRKAQ